MIKDRKEESRRYYLKNKDKIKIRDKTYYQSNKDMVNKRNREYYNENKENILEHKRKYQKDNPEVFLERNRNYRANNQEKVIAYRKKHRAINRPTLIKKSREYYDKNRVELIKKKMEYDKATNYKNDRTPAKRVAKRIRSLTKYKFPLDGQTCQECNAPAVERHHTTKPMQIDKFKYLCHECHKIEHRKLREGIIQYN